MLCASKEQCQIFLSSSCLSMEATWRRWSWTALNLGSHTMRGNRGANNSTIVARDWVQAGGNGQTLQLSTTLFNKKPFTWDASSAIPCRVACRLHQFGPLMQSFSFPYMDTRELLKAPQVISWLQDETVS